MNNKQLKAAIKMGRNVANGKLNIVSLDNKNLELRGRSRKVRRRKLRRQPAPRMVPDSVTSKSKVREANLTQPPKVHSASKLLRQ